MKNYSCTYTLNSSLINAQGKLGLYGLLNLLQDVASTHAEKLGFGRTGMSELKLFWVLTRQHVRMTKWPKWNEYLTIETFIRAEEGLATNRDFRIKLGDEVIGESTTSWLALSAETRRPVVPDQKALFGDIQVKDRVSLNTTKVALQNGGEKLTSFKVRNSDIDSNMHVNNTRYSQWILDAIPFEDHFKFQLTDYEVNFLLETHLNDVIRIERTTLGHGHVQFQGVRESDEKVVFTAAMRIIEKEMGSSTRS